MTLILISESPNLTPPREMSHKATIEGLVTSTHWCFYGNLKGEMEALSHFLPSEFMVLCKISPPGN